MDLISEVLINTRNFLLSQTKEKRKKIGQFFTDEQTALYMANMFDLSNSKGKIRVLDPGTGTGVLSAAFIETAIKQNISNIELVLVENNLDVLPILKENIKLFTNLKDIKISVTLIEENFITFQSNNFRKKTPSKLGKFDYIICNPPYLKIPRNSEETIHMDEVISGAPNLYFLFMTLSIYNLVDNGEMVYIIPRSWTSGAYFKKFRNYIFDNASLSQVHLFARRDRVFSIEKVLQETIIVKFIKSKKADIVTLTSSEDNTFSNIITHLPSQKVLVQGSSKYVFLPTSSEEIQLLQRIGKFNNTLPKLGMKLKTGLTVDFKNKNRLKKQAEKETVPLLFPFNIDNGRIKFPNKNKETYQYLLPTNGMKQINKDYIFIKRFSSKEEKYRLQPAIYLCEDIKTQFISTDNKLNFIERIDKQPIERDIIFGLFVIFNSTYYDTYYRILNGSTQVNSTEINDLPIPNKNELEHLGQLFKQSQNFTREFSDNLLGDILKS